MSWRRTLFIALALAMSGLIAPALGQMSDPGKAHYFLMGRFGEICTMCEVVVLCEAGDDDVTAEEIPATGSFTLYYIQTRTFWSQISTIWEWFISNFDGMAIDGHERPVWVYEVTNENWSGPELVNARVTLEPGLIRLGSHSIERVERRWQEEPGAQPIGYCQRLPLWTSIETIKRNAPGEPAT